MEVPFTSSPSGAICARHANERAITICSRCGSYACSQCHERGADGKDYCFECNQRAPALGDRSARFVANLVDNFIVFIPMLGAAFFTDMTRWMNLSSAAADAVVGLAALVTLGAIGYQLYLARYGQSIGKRMCRLRVVRTDGSRASLGRILFLRNLVPWVIGSFCGFFGIIDVMTIFGEERRCIHDLVADTKVIQVSSDTNYND